MIDCGIALLHEEDYPVNLKKIYKPPLQLYYKGDISIFHNRVCLSIVGSRKHSQYGNRIISDLICSLSQLSASLVIVSGLAMGIDTLVHRKCIASGLRTAAVMPLGLNRVTPLINEEIYCQIIENRGAILAEDYRVERFHKYLYSRRNRIIAGLSNMTIIVEAGFNSGAVITANFAFQENRDVFAVPGNVYSQFSIGSNQLISENKAQIYLSPAQVIAELARWAG